MKRRIVTPELKAKMLELEKEGKTRKQIAEQLDLDQSTVTKHLGAVRSYRGLRMSYA